MAVPSDVFTLINQAASLPSVVYLMGSLLGVAALLWPLERFFPAHKQPLVQYCGVRLDLIYWFFTPIVTKVCTNVILSAVLVGLFYLCGRDLNGTLLDGYGALSRQSLWIQSIEILLLADLIDYWTHRTFHLSSLWRFHAIHHSPTELNWISSSRMHPLNDLVTRLFQVVPIALLGYSVQAIVVVVPYLFFYVIFIHSNLSWDFGPFRWLLVSPAYHRWHHTSDAEGIDKNFSGIFPVWDLLFGTAYFPRRLPKNYGVVKETVPNTLMGQLLFPFIGEKEVRKPNDLLATPLNEVANK